MKKIIVLFLCFISVFCMFSCKNTKTNTNSIGENNSGSNNQSGINQGNSENNNQIVTFIINYDLGEVSSDVNANILAKTQKVEKGANYTLLIPSCDGYDFIKWVDKETKKEVVDGVYNFDSDITIVAQWEIDLTSKRWVYDPNGRI